MAKSFGLAASIALVIGNMVGAGIFMTPVSLAPYGAMSLVGWLITAVGALALAFVFARLSKTTAKAGGPYLYAKEQFGDFIGFLMAWGYWLCTWTSNAAIAVAAVSYLSVLIPQISTNSAFSCLTALVLVWLATIINIVGVKQTAISGLAITVLKILPLIAVGVMGLFFVDTSNFVPFNPSHQDTFSAVAAIVTITLWAFIGLESATIPADHVQDATRTIPKATLIGSVICTVIYISVTTSVLGLIPSTELASSSAPVADAASHLFGLWARPLVAFGAVVSAFGALVGWILIQGQMPLAAARDGLFPSLFAKISRNQVPVLGIVISSCLVSILLTMNYVDSLAQQFTTIVTVASFCTLVPYVFACIAYMLQLVNKKPTSNTQLVCFFALSMLALIFSLWAIYGSGQESIMLGTGLFLLGIPLYLGQKFRQTKLQIGL